MNQKVEFILFVADQNRSRDFYTKILGLKPVLDVPGMTEYELNPWCLLGLMPEEGISRILSGKTPAPESGNGIPRCELYLSVDNPDESLQRAVSNGALLIDPVKERNWGHIVGYVQDYDGNIIAFSKVINKE